MTPNKLNQVLVRSRTVVVASVFAMLVVSCGGGEEVRTVAIVNTLDSLASIVTSLETELLAADPDIEFIYVDLSEPLDEAIASLLADAPDVIVSLNTPVSLAVGAHADRAGVPQVFGMVTDPLGSDLVDSNAAPGRNRTGVGLLQVQQTVDLTVRAVGARSIAVLHQPSDPASVSGLALAQSEASRLGVELTTMVVETDDDLDDVLRSGPPEEADVFLLVGSPFAARQLGDISLVVRTWDIPAVSALTVDRLPPGFTLGVAPDSADLGRQMAERVIAILNGGSAGQIPVGVAENVTIIDLDQADSFELVLSNGVLADFDAIVGGT